MEEKKKDCPKPHEKPEKPDKPCHPGGCAPEKPACAKCAPARPCRPDLCAPRPVQNDCRCPDARQLLRWALWNTGIFRCDNSCKSGWSSRKRWR